MRTRFAAVLVCLALTLGAAPSSTPSAPQPKAFDVLGLKAYITVKRGNATLSASLVPYLKAGDVVNISFPKNVQFQNDPRRHLVVAEMYPTSQDKAPTFPISDADLSAQKPGHVWSFTDDGLGTPVIFLVPENGSRYGHGIPQARAAIADDANRSLLMHSALFSSNAVAKASTLDSLMRSLRAADGAAAADGGARVEAAATTLFGTAPGTSGCFAGGTGGATEYACASAAVAADYQTPTNVALATTLGSQIAVNAAPYGIIIGALYELLAKRRVEANYQFVPGALKPPRRASNVYAESPLQYDPAGTKPSSILYFQIGSQGRRGTDPSFGKVPPLPACVTKSTLAVAVPFSGLPVYFRAHSMTISTSSGAFDVPATFDPVDGYSASLSGAQLAAIRSGATATIASDWGFETYKSAPVELVVPRAVPWTLDAQNSQTVIAGEHSATLTFADADAGMGSCVSSVAVYDGLHHPMPVLSVKRSRDAVSVTVDASGARGAVGSASVILDGNIVGKVLAFDVLPALPNITEATAYLPKGTLVLAGTNLKYIDTVTLNGSNVTFGNGQPIDGNEDAWRFFATSPPEYRAAWEHKTMTITYALEPPGKRTDSSEVNVVYAAATPCASPSPQLDASMQPTRPQ